MQQKKSNKMIKFNHYQIEVYMLVYDNNKSDDEE